MLRGYSRSRAGVSRAPVIGGAKTAIGGTRWGPLGRCRSRALGRKCWRTPVVVLVVVFGGCVARLLRLICSR